MGGQKGIPFFLSKFLGSLFFKHPELIQYSDTTSSDGNDYTYELEADKWELWVSYWKPVSAALPLFVYPKLPAETEEDSDILKNSTRYCGELMDIAQQRSRWKITLLPRWSPTFSKVRA